MQNKVFDNIPFRRRLILLIGVIVVFGLVSGLTFLHTMNSLSEMRQLEKDFDNCFNAIHEMDRHLQNLGLAYMDTTIDYVDILAGFQEITSAFREDINQLNQHPTLRDHDRVTESFSGILQKTRAFESKVTEMVNRHLEVEPVSEFNTLHHEYLDPINQNRIFIRDLIYDISFRKQRTYSANLLLLMFLNVIIITLIILINMINSSRNAARLTAFTRELGKGRRPGKLQFSGGSEFHEIAGNLNDFLDRQEEKIHYLKTIGETDTLPFEPEEGDVIGNEIKIMTGRLQKVQAEERARHAEDKKRNWTSEGIAQFAEILRSEREDVRELSFLVIQKLVTYLGIEMGTIFLTSDKEGNGRRLETIAAYAYDRRKYVDRSFAFGEGLPGTCALEKQKIYIDDIPEDYSEVISGVGQTKPRYVLVVPMMIEEEIFGILELASFRKLEEHELNFVDQLAESIASTLLSVKTNERTASLLHQSREQAEKLMQQEDEMKKNLEALQHAQEESLKKESEISGILNAMNESSLVAEFNLNGRFTHVNEKFLELLESPAEMILGKHHHEFIVTDKYSDEYKEFWNQLREGQSVAREELIRLYSGREIWLQQTYTPIRNQENKIYKILNIAVDITRSKQQQESLEKQAVEIRRQNLEMESLNHAVNSSIIKAELDQDGIILDINGNFETVSGLNRKEILGRNYRLFLKDMEKEQFEKIWQEVMKGKTYEGATRRTRPTGEEVWLMSTFSPVKDNEGVIYKIYFLALDITEKKLKYQLLEEANKEIERLRSQKQS